VTLIASVLTPRLVAQVSDRRLAQPNGTFVTDAAVKAINVTCLNGRFSIAYTGLGIIGTIRTDLWVVDYLRATKAARMSVRQLAEGLTAALQSEFRRHPHLPLALVSAGYIANEPFLGTISNFIRDGVQLKRALPEFLCQSIGLPSTHKDALAIGFYGLEEAVTAGIETKVTSLRRRRFFRNAKPLELVDRLVRIVRKASNTPGCQPFISKACL
jgi:hypothetical protein